jgi:hypothetical protein
MSHNQSAEQNHNINIAYVSFKNSLYTFKRPWQNTMGTTVTTQKLVKQLRAVQNILLCSLFLEA